MEPIEEHPIRRFESGRGRAACDSVVVEARIEVDVNDGQARLAMLCLPADLEALAVGFLCGEGALRRREDLADVRLAPDGRTVALRGDFDADALAALGQRWTWGSGCGRGGTARDLDEPPFAPVGPGRPVSTRRLQLLARALQQRGQLWRRTGGVHACALARADEPTGRAPDADDGILLFAEDIGRHNAFDKVVGRACLDGIDLADKLMLMTGRLSAEIVSKAVACRLPMLASRSAPTSLAVRLARRFGLTLVGFLRGSRMNVYTGFQRIEAAEIPGEAGG